MGVDGGTLIPADEHISLTVRFWWGVLLVLVPVRLLVLLAACRLLGTLLPGLLLLLLLLFSFDRCSSSQFSCDGNRCCAPACVPAVSVYEIVQICCWAFSLSRRRQPRPPRATPSPYPSVSSLSLGGIALCWQCGAVRCCRPQPGDPDYVRPADPYKRQRLVDDAGSNPYGGEREKLMGRDRERKRDRDRDRETDWPAWCAHYY